VLLLAGAVLAVVALLLGELWFGVKPRGTTGAGAAALAALARASAPRASEPTPAAGAPGAIVPAPIRGAHTPTVEELGGHGMERLLAGEIPQTLFRAAATCYRGEPGRYETLEIDYTLHIQADTAELRNLEVASSAWNAPRLQACVLHKLTELSWHQEGAPDLDRAMRQSISIRDLQARQGRGIEPTGDDEAAAAEDF
jgi:hypothetical protein